MNRLYNRQGKPVIYLNNMPIFCRRHYRWVSSAFLSKAGLERRKVPFFYPYEDRRESQRRGRYWKEPLMDRRSYTERDGTHLGSETYGPADRRRWYYGYKPY